MRYVIRTGKSTTRFTQGSSYQLDSEDNILDNNNNLWRPEAVAGFWELVDNSDTTPPSYFKYNPQPSYKAGQGAGVTSTTTEDTTMTTTQPYTTIEDVTLINKRDSNEFSDEALIDLIIAEEDKLTDLDRVSVKSEAIKTLRNKHIKTINALRDILDARDEQLS